MISDSNLSGCSGDQPVRETARPGKSPSGPVFSAGSNSRPAREHVGQNSSSPPRYNGVKSDKPAASSPSPARVFFQVECSTVESVRRVIFSELTGLSPQQQRLVAIRITRRLRDERWLRSAAEECYEAGELARLWGRSREWVVRTFCADGAMPWGAISRDGGGWLVPASVAEHYLAGHAPTEKVAGEKSARGGFGRGRKVFQKANGAIGRARTVRLDEGDSAGCADAASVGEAGFARIGGG